MLVCSLFKTNVDVIILLHGFQHVALFINGSHYLSPPLKSFSLTSPRVAKALLALLRCSSSRALITASGSSTVEIAEIAVLRSTTSSNVLAVVASSWTLWGTVRLNVALTFLANSPVISSGKVAPIANANLNNCLIDSLNFRSFIFAALLIDCSLNSNAVPDALPNTSSLKLATFDLV